MGKPKVRTLLVASWLIAGMLLASIVPLTMMPAKAYAQSSRITIDGAGATFPFPLIDTWRVEYQSVEPDVSLNYQSIGSGGGIRQFTERTVDFGGTDAPLTLTQRAALAGPAVHIPETIGSVVAAYNVVGIPDKGLRLTGPVLAEIFLGHITKWDDPKIKELNPEITLPSRDIVVVHRSDGSGTTFVWTDYLSKVSPEWDLKVGKGTAVSWPTGIGSPGNEGVANSIRGTAYTIGYVELAYALTTGMDYAFLQNREGDFIEPTLESVRAAVSASAQTLPKGEESWETVSLVDAPGADSYPVASFSYLLLYKELSTNPKTNSPEKAKALVDFVSWAITDGQEFADMDPLDYVPLPEAVVKLNQETLAGLTYNGEPVIKAGEEGPPMPAPTPTPTQTPSQTPTPFTSSSTLDGKNYTITGKSATSKVTQFTINPNKSVEFAVDKAGEVELTLPKDMIDRLTAVMDGENVIAHQTVSSDSSSTTIKFTVPENTESVEILGTFVVPEFPVVAALILAASMVAIIGYTRFARNGTRMGMGL